MNHLLFIHSSVGGHLSCFQPFLAIVNNADMSIFYRYLFEYLFSILLGILLEVELLHSNSVF